MQSTFSKGIFTLPALFPRKKILSFDIGGTLAKVAFYVPKDDPKFHTDRGPNILREDLKRLIPM
jgi:hypothetical protein